MPWYLLNTKTYQILLPGSLISEVKKMGMEVLEGIH